MVDSIRRWTRVRPATLALVVGLGLALGGCAQAPKSSPATGPTSAKRLPAPSLTDDPGYTPAEPAPARHTDDLGRALQRDAPRRYVVQPGDTLWDIAGRYLRAPWYWQQLWQANPNLAAPDRIYPGDVLVLSKDMDGTPHLTRERRTVRLSPQVRTAPLDSAIPTIPVASLRAFLQSPRRVTAAELAHAPYVVAVGDGQLVAGNDARLYIRGLGANAPSRLALVRPDSAYAGTDDSADRSPRAIPVGEVEILRQAAEPAEEISGNGEADIATARFVRALREARPGDRLLPIREAALAEDFHPRTPDRPVATRIVSVYGGISQIGRFDVVALADSDEARPAALTRGDVLDIYQAGDTVIDPVTDEPLRLPERRAGRLMVFDADGDVSYALVMRAERAIHVGDIARTPGRL